MMWLWDCARATVQVRDGSLPVVRLNRRGAGPASMAFVAVSLAANGNVNTLNMSSNRVAGVGSTFLYGEDQTFDSAGVLALARLLTNNRSISRLVLGGNKLQVAVDDTDVHAVQALSDAIKVRLPAVHLKYSEC
jgi:hypothetical protein